MPNNKGNNEIPNKGDNEILTEENKENQEPNSDSQPPLPTTSPPLLRSQTLNPDLGDEIHKLLRPVNKAGTLVLDPISKPEFNINEFSKRDKLYLMKRIIEVDLKTLEGLLKFTKENKISDEQVKIEHKIEALKEVEKSVNALIEKGSAVIVGNLPENNLYYNINEFKELLNPEQSAFSSSAFQEDIRVNKFLHKGLLTDLLILDHLPIRNLDMKNGDQIVNSLFKDLQVDVSTEEELHYKSEIDNLVNSIDSYLDTLVETKLDLIYKKRNDKQNVKTFGENISNDLLDEKILKKSESLNNNLKDKLNKGTGVDLQYENWNAEGEKNHPTKTDIRADVLDIFYHKDKEIEKVTQEYQSLTQFFKKVKQELETEYAAKSLSESVKEKTRSSSLPRISDVNSTWQGKVVRAEVPMKVRLDQVEAKNLISIRNNWKQLYLLIEAMKLSINPTQQDIDNFKTTRANLQSKTKPSTLRDLPFQNALNGCAEAIEGQYEKSKLNVEKNNSKDAKNALTSVETSKFGKLTANEKPVTLLPHEEEFVEVIKGFDEEVVEGASIKDKLKNKPYEFTKKEWNTILNFYQGELKAMVKKAQENNQAVPPVLKEMIKITEEIIYSTVMASVETEEVTAENQIKTTTINNNMKDFTTQFDADFTTQFDEFKKTYAYKTIPADQEVKSFSQVKVKPKVSIHEESKFTSSKPKSDQNMPSYENFDEAATVLPGYKKEDIEALNKQINESKKEKDNGVFDQAATVLPGYKKEDIEALNTQINESKEQKDHGVGRFYLLGGLVSTYAGIIKKPENQRNDLEKKFVEHFNNIYARECARNDSKGSPFLKYTNVRDYYYFNDDKEENNDDKDKEENLKVLITDLKRGFHLTTDELREFEVMYAFSASPDNEKFRLPEDAMNLKIARDMAAEEEEERMAREAVRKQQQNYDYFAGIFNHINTSLKQANDNLNKEDGLEAAKALLNKLQGQTIVIEQNDEGNDVASIKLTNDKKEAFGKLSKDQKESLVMLIYDIENNILALHNNIKAVEIAKNQDLNVSVELTNITQQDKEKEEIKIRLEAVKAAVEVVSGMQTTNAAELQAAREAFNKMLTEQQVEKTSAEGVNPATYSIRFNKDDQAIIEDDKGLQDSKQSIEDNIAALNTRLSQVEQEQEIQRAAAEQAAQAQVEQAQEQAQTQTLLDSLNQIKQEADKEKVRLNDLDLEKGQILALGNALNAAKNKREEIVNKLKSIYDKINADVKLTKNEGLKQATQLALASIKELDHFGLQTDALVAVENIGRDAADQVGIEELTLEQLEEQDKVNEARWNDILQLERALYKRNRDDEGEVVDRNEKNKISEVLKRARKNVLSLKSKLELAKHNLLIGEVERIGNEAEGVKTEAMDKNALDEEYVLIQRRFGNVARLEEVLRRSNRWIDQDGIERYDEEKEEKIDDAANKAKLKIGQLQAEIKNKYQELKKVDEPTPTPTPATPPIRSLPGNGWVIVRSKPDKNELEKLARAKGENILKAKHKDIDILRTISTALDTNVIADKGKFNEVANMKNTVLLQNIEAPSNVKVATTTNNVLKAVATLIEAVKPGNSFNIKLPKNITEATTLSDKQIQNILQARLKQNIILRFNSEGRLVASGKRIGLTKESEERKTTALPREDNRSKPDTTSTIKSASFRVLPSTTLPSTDISRDESKEQTPKTEKKLPLAGKELKRIHTIYTGDEKKIRQASQPNRGSNETVNSSKIDDKSTEELRSENILPVTELQPLRTSSEIGGEEKTKKRLSEFDEYVEESREKLLESIQKMVSKDAYEAITTLKYVDLQRVNNDIEKLRNLGGSDEISKQEKALKDLQEKDSNVQAEADSILEAFNTAVGAYLPSDKTADIVNHYTTATVVEVEQASDMSNDSWFNDNDEILSSSMDGEEKSTDINDSLTSVSSFYLEGGVQRSALNEISSLEESNTSSLVNLLEALDSEKTYYPPRTEVANKSEEINKSSSSLPKSSVDSSPESSVDSSPDDSVDEANISTTSKTSNTSSLIKV